MVQGLGLNTNPLIYDRMGAVQVFGEPKGQASRALPDGSMDNTMGQLAGVGMGAASAILFAHLLKGAAL